MVKPMLHGQLAAMKEYFDRSTKVLAEADSSFAPVEGMYTVVQHVSHAAQTVDWFMAGAFAEAFDMDFESMDKAIKAITSLRAARDWVDRACEEAKGVIENHSEAEWEELLPPGPIMGGVPRLGVLNALTDHFAHHRGALAVYTRLLGKVPPMPYMDM